MDARWGTLVDVPGAVPYLMYSYTLERYGQVSMFGYSCHGTVGRGVADVRGAVPYPDVQFYPGAVRAGVHGRLLMSWNGGGRLQTCLAMYHT
jgi:hypothetical protein